MSTTLRFKRRVSGATGAPSSLKTAEIAYNMVDGLLYVGYGDDGNGNATSIKTFAKDNFVDPSGVYQPLNANLTAVSNLAATGGSVHRTGAGTFAIRTLTGTAARLTVTNGDGVSGNPTFDLATVSVGTTTTGGFTKFTVDGYGRVTNQSAATLNDLNVPTADASIGGFKLTNVASPINAGDAANKAYVDNTVNSALQGYDAKPSARIATTANITLSGNQTIDGVATAAGDRILVKNQTNAYDNGIYLASASSWTRATDFDAWTKIPGAYVTVEEGSTLADTFWLSTANQNGTLGTTNITWSQVGGSTGFSVAGNGLTSSGSTVSVNPGAGITVSAGTTALTGQALALHNVATAADQVIYATGSATFAVTAFSSFGRSLVGAASASAAQTTLGLGTMAIQNASAVAITGGTIDGITLDGGTF